MNSRLDDLLGRLASASAEAPPQLEPVVWGRIQERELWAWAPPAQARLGAVAFGLVVGIAMGGMVAASATPGFRELSVFGERPELAPSTLLESVR